MTGPGPDDPGRPGVIAGHDSRPWLHMAKAVSGRAAILRAGRIPFEAPFAPPAGCRALIMMLHAIRAADRAAPPSCGGRTSAPSPRPVRAAPLQARLLIRPVAPGSFQTLRQGAPRGGGAGTSDSTIPDRAMASRPCPARFAEGSRQGHEPPAPHPARACTAGCPFLRQRQRYRTGQKAPSFWQRFRPQDPRDPTIHARPGSQRPAPAPPPAPGA